MDEIIRTKAGLLINMDGFLYRGNNVLVGVLEFVAWLKANDKQ